MKKALFLVLSLAFLLTACGDAAPKHLKKHEPNTEVSGPCFSYFLESALQ